MAQDRLPVLLVDDNADDADALSALLRTEGWDTEVLSRPQAAVDAVLANPGRFGAVFLDERFARDSVRSDRVRTGVQAIGVIVRDLPAGEHPTLILLTGYGNCSLSHQALDAGADRCMFKHGDPQRAVAFLRALPHIRALQQEIDSSRERSPWLHQLVTRLGVGVSVIDPSFAIMYTNECQRQISRAGARAGGVCWVEYNDAPYQPAPCHYCPTIQAFQTKLTHTSITVSPVKGVTRYFRVVATPLFLPEEFERVLAAATSGGTLEEALDALSQEFGEPIAVLETVTDVTEEEANKQLVHAGTEGTTEERLKTVLEAVLRYGCTGARLYRAEPGGKRLSGLVSVGAGPDSSSFTGRCLDADIDGYTRNTLASRQPQQYEGHEHGSPVEMPGLEDRERWVDVPLIHRDLLVGKLSADRQKRWAPDGTPENRPFTPPEIEQIAVLGRHASELLYREFWELRPMRDLIELAEALQAERDPDIVIACFLTVLASAFGQDFDRALFFERRGQHFEGTLAVGSLEAADWEERGREGRMVSLEDALRRVRVVGRARSAMTDAIAGVRVPLVQTDDHQVGAGGATRPFRLRDAVSEPVPGALLALIDLDSAWVLPLHAHGNVPGFIVCDRPFSDGERSADREHLQLLTGIAAVAIHAALADSRRRAMLTSTGHELRSNVSEVMQQAERLTRCLAPLGDSLVELRRAYASLEELYAALEDGLAMLGEAYADLDGVCDAARDIERVVENVLAIERIESGETAPKKADLYLDKVVSEVLARPCSCMPEWSGEVGWVPERAGIVAWGDEGMVTIMLRNLVHNATQAASPIGRVEIGAAQDDGTGAVRVEVTNEGRPIDLVLAANLGRGELPLRSLEAKHTQGLGLGLRIVASYAAAHDGRFGIEPVKDGTVAWFTLPSKPSWQESPGGAAG